MNQDIKYTLVRTAAGLVLIIILLTCHVWTTPVFFITLAVMIVLWLLSVIQLVRKVKQSKRK